MSITEPSTNVVHELCAELLHSSPGSALLADNRGDLIPLAAAGHHYGALVGLRCPAEIDAVAGILDANVRVDSCWTQARVAWSLDRHGRCAVRIESLGRRTLGFDAVAGPLLDISRRSLGVTTPPAPDPVVTLADAIFFDRALSLILESELGRTPTWSEISALHPLAEGDALSADELLDRRRQFEMQYTWEALRLVASRAPRGALCIAQGLDCGVASWLDAGSFARWVLTELPDLDDARADVTQLVGHDAAQMLAEAMSPV